MILLFWHAEDLVRVIHTLVSDTFETAIIFGR